MVLVVHPPMRRSSHDSDRGYVRVEIVVSTLKMGEIVTDRLEENFRELMNYDFTAQMEDSLDPVANHEAEWWKLYWITSSRDFTSS